MMSFVKLDCGILDSSLWREDAETCKVFLTMLAMTEPSGLCPSTAPGIAARANVPLERVMNALEKLAAPDQHSRTLDQEGRRIERVDGGYNIVNYLKYREKRLAEDRKEQVRQAVAKHREKMKSDVIIGKPCKPKKKEKEEGEVEAEVEGDKSSSSPEVTEPSGFLDFWKCYPRKVGKGAARKWWIKHKPNEATIGAIMLAMIEQRSWKSWGDVQFIPHPATWLNGERWNDENPANSSVPSKSSVNRPQPPATAADFAASKEEKPW